MADLPTNKAAVVTQKIIAGLFQILEAFLEQAGESYQPWLNAPVVKQIFELVVNKIGEKLSSILQDDGTVLIITFQTNMDLKHYTDAMNNLRTIGDPDALERAKKAADAVIQWPH